MSAHFVSRTLRKLGFEPRIIPAIYVKSFLKGQKNVYNDAEAALRPNLRMVREKTQDQLDLQALHRVRSRLISRRAATNNQIRAFLIEQGIAVRACAHALRKSLFTILDLQRDEISERMHDIVIGLYADWLWLDERVEGITDEIEVLSDREVHCIGLKSIPGIGPIISTATVSSIGTGEAFERGRDFAAWIGLMPRQHSTGGKPIPGCTPNRLASSDTVCSLFSTSSATFALNSGLYCFRFDTVDLQKLATNRHGPVAYVTVRLAGSGS